MEKVIELWYSWNIVENGFSSELDWVGVLKKIHVVQA